MRVTEPWDPLGHHFVEDIVNDLFAEPTRTIEKPGYTIMEDDVYPCTCPNWPFDVDERCVNPSAALVLLSETPQFWVWFYAGQFKMQICGMRAYDHSYVGAATEFYLFYGRTNVMRFSSFYTEFMVYLSWKVLHDN